MHSNRSLRTNTVLKAVVAVFFFFLAYFLFVLPQEKVLYAQCSNRIRCEYNCAGSTCDYLVPCSGACIPPSCTASCALGDELVFDGCTLSCPGVPTPTPGGACSSGLYPACKQGSCGGSSKCRQDEKGGCKCIPVKTAIAKGAHDPSTGCNVRGWACDESDFSRPLSIHIYEGAKFLGAVLADDGAEPGVAAACGGYSNHRFTAALSETYKDGIAHTFCTYAIGIKPDGSPDGINPNLPVCRTVTCAIPTPTPITPTPTPITPTPTPPTPTPTSTPTPVPTLAVCDCSTANLFPGSLSRSVGDTATFSSDPAPFISPGGCTTVGQVQFTSLNAGVASATSPDSSAPYTTTASCLAAGSATIRARAVLENGQDCYDNSTLTCAAAITPTPTPTPTPIPDSCTINLIPPSPPGIDIGDTRPYSVSFVTLVGTPVKADFSVVANPSVASVTTPDSILPFTTTATALSDGTATIMAEVTMPDGAKCWDTATLTVIAPTCDIDLVGPSSVDFLETAEYLVSINDIQPPGFPIDEVRFTTDPANASVCDVLTATCPPGVGSYTDTSAAYRVNLTGYSIAPTSITASMVIAGAVTCSSTVNIDVSNPDPWWQVAGGDIIAASGDLVSEIPGSCDPSSASCQPYLILDKNTGVGDVESAAMPIYAGGISVGSGNISSSNVHSRSGIDLSQDYDYQYFYDKAQGVGSVFNTANPADIAAGVGTATEGYRLYSSGALTIGSDITIADGVKAVVFVDGDLNINGKITFANVGTTFLIFFVRGNIVVDSGVGDGKQNLASATPPDPDLEGIYATDGQFKIPSNGTGNDLQLFVRGTIVGHGNLGAVNGVLLKRKFDNNAFHPAEIFRFAPDQLFLFPPFLSTKSVRWTEVAP